MNNRPTIVVVTPVRNEAWVIDAFLTCASSWADYIFLADQHSDDGTREIASKYEKVKLIDNDLAEMNQAATRELLFQEADKIEGDKIVFALDADEFLSEGFEKSEDWRRIMESKPNEIFCFKWLNLYGDYKHVVPNTGYMEWACHFGPGTSLAQEYHNYERRAVHEMRVPCLPTTRVSYILLDEIKFVHLARLNLVRQKNKEAFYQVSSVAKLQTRMSAIGLYRSYNSPQSEKEVLNEEISLYISNTGLDARNLVKMGDEGQYYIDEIVKILRRDGYKKYLKIDIWDNPYLIKAGISPKVPLRYKLLHAYLRNTRNWVGKKAVRWLDRILKVFV